MNNFGLRLPNRESKPRNKGITVLIDNGIPIQLFKDYIKSASAYIDFVKFGWGTSVVTKYLEQKMESLKENNVKFFFGGTLFEKYVSQERVDEFYQLCQKYGCEYVEISNGTIPLSNKEKAKYIKSFSREFLVFSEVGSKDSLSSLNENIADWIEWMREDLEAGAHKVITEARESGTSGICSSNGELRFDLIDRILDSKIDLDRVIFEAPNKKLQTAFIKLVGPDVNLANIPFADSLSVETLRLGLRSDTFDIS
jgi:phosphosulfolactate synthase